MKFKSSLFLNSLILNSLIASGSLISLGTWPSLAQTAPTSAVNPCPKIYYEEPHNSQRPAPQGCPPNAASQLQSAQVPVAPLTTQAPPNQAPPNQAPLPEQQQTPIATIVLQSGKVTIQMRNTTNAQITYQAIGHTQQRTLSANESVSLQSLPAPVTITLLRPDGGLVNVIPVEASEPGVLSLMLSEGMGLSDSQTTVRVQSNGSVVAY